MGTGIGVYLCACGTNIAEHLDLEELAKFSMQLPGVRYAKSHNLLCSEAGKEFLSGDIASEKPDRIVVAACTPKEHEATFRKACSAGGLNPYLFQMVNLREQVAWVHPDRGDATEKAKAYLRAAVRRVALHEPLERREIECTADLLVIGAGSAGMEAAMVAAEAGRTVYLVEKSPAIGGEVVKQEKLFPNLECGPCMLEPRMDEVLHHEHIRLYTCSEVTEVLGFLGNFVAKIEKKARAVEIENCYGCSACFEPCPVTVKNEYNYGLSERKAIYFPYAGALPNAPVVDRQNCLRFRGEQCSQCSDACPFGAINFDEQDETVEVRAGGIVVANGFGLFDPAAIPALGYGTIPEVYTSLEFERLASETGPTEGVIRRKDGAAPASLAILHCVGSRDERYREYCSGVCCLYALKFAHLVHEKLPEAKIHHLFTDWCLPGKDGQEFFRSVCGHGGAALHRMAHPNDCSIAQRGESIAISYTDLAGAEGEAIADMVVLCPAIIPSPDNAKIAGMLSLGIDRNGFFNELQAKSAPVSTTIEGVFVAGCAQGPKDIPCSVAQGAAAAGHLLSTLVPGRKLELESITAFIDEALCGGCRVCVPLCPFKAITYDEAKKTAVVNEVLCKGCGVCVAACPSGADSGKHFTTQQIFAEIEGVLA